MWVAVLLGGWLATSLLLGPWVGRFASTHAKIREETAVTKSATQTEAKPIPIARQA